MIDKFITSCMYKIDEELENYEYSKDGKNKMS
jgi:hypothetical protein